MPNQKIFNQHYQHTNNEAASSICSEEIVPVKILQSDWPRAFWSISQKQDLCMNTANFNYKRNSVKTNNQIFQTLFLDCSPTFLGKKKSFPKKSGCHVQLHGFLAPWENSEKSNDPIQNNTQTYVSREGWTDLISEYPSSYHQGSNKYNCSRLTFKSQRQGMMLV